MKISSNLSHIQVSSFSSIHRCGCNLYEIQVKTTNDERARVNKKKCASNEHYVYSNYDDNLEEIRRTTTNVNNTENWTDKG